MKKSEKSKDESLICLGNNLLSGNQFYELCKDKQNNWQNIYTFFSKDISSEKFKNCYSGTYSQCFALMSQNKQISNIYLAIKGRYTLKKDGTQVNKKILNRYFFMERNNKGVLDRHVKLTKENIFIEEYIGNLDDAELDYKYIKQLNSEPSKRNTYICFPQKTRKRDIFSIIKNSNFKIERKVYQIFSSKFYNKHEYINGNYSQIYKSSTTNLIYRLSCNFTYDVKSSMVRKEIGGYDYDDEADLVSNHNIIDEKTGNNTVFYDCADDLYSRHEDCETWDCIKNEDIDGKLAKNLLMNHIEKFIVYIKEPQLINIKNKKIIADPTEKMLIDVSCL